MKAFYRYCVTFYNEVESKEVTRTGITCGATYAEATENIGSYYGDDNILHFMCECIGADSCYECETMGMVPKFY